MFNQSHRKFIVRTFVVVNLVLANIFVESLFTQNELSLAFEGGCDLITVSREPFLSIGIDDHPFPTIVAWVPWPQDFMHALSFTAPEVIHILPKNPSEFIQTLDTIRATLDKTKWNWRIWSPYFFIHWPLNNNSMGENLAGLIEILTKFESMNSFGMDSNIFIYYYQNVSNDASEARTWLHVYEVYSVGKKLQILRVDLEFEKYFVFSNYFPKSVRRRNFNQAVIVATAYNDPDYRLQMKWEHQADGSIEFVSGVSVELFLALEFGLNFTHRVVAGDGWVHKEKNGSWSGMAKQLQNSEADISISLSTIMPERLEGLDFLYPLSKVPSQAFFRQPEAGTMRDILISPLSFSVWISLLGMWSLLVLTLWLMYWARQRCTSHVEPCDAEVLNGSLLWILSTSCQQGWYTYPLATSMRIVFLCGSFFGFVYFIVFSAALVPILYIESVPIKTIEELGTSSIRILCDRSFPNGDKIVEEIQYFRQSTNYVKPNASDQFIGIDEAIPQLFQGNTAFLTFTDGFLTVLHRHNFTDPQICATFYSIPLTRVPYVGGFVIRKGSEYKEIFNHKILMIQESGISSRNFRIYEFFTKAQCKDRGNKPGEMKLDIPDVSTAYFILIGGAALSLCMILCECLMENSKPRNEWFMF